MRYLAYANQPLVRAAMETKVEKWWDWVEHRIDEGMIEEDRYLAFTTQQTTSGFAIRESEGEIALIFLEDRNIKKITVQQTGDHNTKMVDFGLYETRGGLADDKAEEGFHTPSVIAQRLLRRSLEGWNQAAEGHTPQMDDD